MNNGQQAVESFQQVSQCRPIGGPEEGIMDRAQAKCEKSRKTALSRASSANSRKIRKGIITGTRIGWEKKTEGGFKVA